MLVVVLRKTGIDDFSGWINTPPRASKYHEESPNKLN
jgi:hypothetical protein